MILKIFSIRDRATDQFGTPMFLIADGQALRLFGDAVNKVDVENQIYMHPDDFDLFKLGEFDTDAGLFMCGKPEQVAIGKMVKIRANGKE